MRKLFYLTLLFILSFTSAYCSYDLSADKVKLNSGVLILSGDVSLSLGNTLLESDEMRLSFLGGQLGTKSIDIMTAEGNVSIDYRKLFSAEGHRAEYKLGTITLLPNEAHPRCSVSNDKGFHATMDSAVYTQKTGELVLIQPEGRLEVSVQGAEPVNFRAQQLFWDNASQQLTLIDDVVIELPGLVKLENDDRVTLTWSDHEGKHVLSKLSSSGKSKIQRFDSEGDSSFIVETQGVTFYDVTKGWLTFASDPDHEVHYYDRVGHAFGRELFIDFIPNTTTPSARKISLNNDVKLLTGVIVIEGKVKGASQYVLADTLKFDPKKKTLMMECSDGRRVLFCDKMNHLQMSASKLVMKQDPGMDRPSVKGVGDVRFRLKEKELEQIKKRFYFDEKEQEI